MTVPTGTIVYSLTADRNLTDGRGGANQQPLDGAQINNKSIYITLIGSKTNYTRVNWFLDGVTVGTDSAVPFDYPVWPLDTTGLASGTHTVRARAFAATKLVLDTSAQVVIAPTPEDLYDGHLTGHIMESVTIPDGETWKVDGAVTSDVNVIVEGTLVMRPGDSLIFTNVDESRFVGGGLVVVPSDVGLWIMGHGLLDAVGTAKRTWARATATVALGATSLTLDAAPAGWVAGDRVIIAPTAATTVANYWTLLDDLEILSVAGNVVTFTAGTSYAHPSCTLPDDRVMTAEVMNLTRDVKIGGTEDGRSHVFLHTHVPQTIKYVEFEHLSPLQDSQFVLGRWGLHFHHGGEGVRGSIIEGCTMHDVGGRAMVPHASHGTTWTDCAVHDLELGDGFWWDVDTQEDNSNDTLWDHCLVSKVAGNAFLFAGGTRNVARDCVAFGTTAAVRTFAAFQWPGSLGTPADFNAFDCVAHNIRSDINGNGSGVRLWQNSDVQLVEDFISYRNGQAGIHGAYVNGSTWNRLICAENALPFEMHALGSQFNDCIWDASGGTYSLVTTKHVLGAESILTGCTFLGSTVANFRVNGKSTNHPDKFQVVSCTFEGNEFWLESTIPAASYLHVVDSVHGDITLKRVDQAGTLRAAWNARES